MVIGNGISHAVLFLMVISLLFISLPEVNGWCSGGCSIAGGGTVSSGSFMGDRAVDIELSSFDEFVRDKLGGNSSFNQTGKGNSSQNGSEAILSANNRTAKLGNIGTQESRLSTMAFAAFSNNRI
jgi:hypothetical protein